MTKKIYRSAKGKLIDMGALQLQNEHVRAVGNMGVNARGDRIDAQGRVIETKNRQIDRKMLRQTTATDTAQNPSDIADKKITEEDVADQGMPVPQAKPAKKTAEVKEASANVTLSPADDSQEESQ